MRTEELLGLSGKKLCIRRGPFLDGSFAIENVTVTGEPYHDGYWVSSGVWVSQDIHSVSPTPAVWLPVRAYRKRKLTGWDIRYITGISEGWNTAREIQPEEARCA